jgi:hypothetical protein
MKKLLLLLISLSFIGCSSINVGDRFSSLELDDAMSSEDETQRILALGLTYEENLKEASKLSPHLASVVSLKLTNARDKKIQNEIDLIESQKLAELVKISNNGLSIIGSEQSEINETNILETDFDSQSYYLKGIKNVDTGNISHQLHIAVVHNSKNKREYSSAVLCDGWGRCEDNKQELIAKSVTASNCSTNSCDYEEVMELNLSNEFLKEKMNDGFSMRLISKRKNHKIKISAPYLMSYLSLAK